MKKKKSFIKKFLCLFAIMFTFGLCLLPTCKCAEHYENSVNLDYVNRLSGITWQSTSKQLRLYINNEESFGGSTTKRYTVQMFHKDNLYTPVMLGSLNSFSNVYFYGIYGTQYSATSYTNSSQYCYYITGTNIMSYCAISFTTESGLNYNDYVFNITCTANACYLNHFVPNTYYNVGGENNLGAFQYFKVELFQENVSTSPIDISSQSLAFNKMQFTADLVRQLYNVNNIDSWQYYIRVYFNSSMLDALPNIYCRFLEIKDVKANNNVYNTYSSAQNALPWLGNNVLLYATDASLFKTDALKETYKYDTLQYITFRIADYTFKSSSYYDSSVGINGYLANTYLTSLQSNEVLIANQSFANGKNNGYIEGYNDGFNRATSQGSSSFGSLMLSVADVPIHILYSILNFNILGTNVASLFFAIISLFMFIWLIRRLKE